MKPFDLDGAMRTINLMKQRRRAQPPARFGSDSRYTTLGHVRRHGNRPGTIYQVGPDGLQLVAPMRWDPNLIQCRDGFVFSVIAGAGTYCTPRPDTSVYIGKPFVPSWLAQVPGDYPGPYTHVEVGFFTGRYPRPWKLWRRYCDDRKFVGARLVSVYGYVPVGLVYDLIKLHGGQCRNGSAA